MRFHQRLSGVLADVSRLLRYFAAIRKHRVPRTDTRDAVVHEPRFMNVARSISETGRGRLVDAAGLIPSTLPCFVIADRAVRAVDQSLAVQQAGFC